jgi:hypothetical protein
MNIMGNPECGRPTERDESKYWETWDTVIAEASLVQGYVYSSSYSGIRTSLSEQGEWEHMELSPVGYLQENWPVRVSMWIRSVLFHTAAQLNYAQDMDTCISSPGNNKI